MPTSRWDLVGEIVNLVHTVPHANILDVGPGYGKYGLACRELLNEKPERIDAVEKTVEYIDIHRLVCQYDLVMDGDVCDLPDQVLAAYQVVIMVDVIEHIPFVDAYAVLARIPGRVVISTPVAWCQTDPGLPPAETHVSHWTERQWADLANHRQIEICYMSLGAWIVRLGPLPAP